MAVFWLTAGLMLCIAAPFLASRRSLRAARSYVIAFGVLLSFAGAPLLLLGAYFGGGALLAFGAICSGAGLGLLWLIWADRFVEIGIKGVYLYTVCDAAVALAFNLVGNVFPTAEGTVELLLIACPLASFVLLLRDWNNDGSWLEEGEARESSKAFDRRSIVGLCVVMFSFPLAYHVSTSSLFAEASLLVRDGSDALSLVAFALVLWGVKGKANLVTVYRVAVPLVFGGFLLSSFFSEQAATVSALAAGSGFKLAVLFFWVLLLQAAPKGPARWIVLASGLAARFLGNSAALFLGSLVPAGALEGWNGFAMIAVIAAVLVCVVLWTLPGKAEAGASAPVSPSVSDGVFEGSLESLCASISDEYRLTRRESEVFLLLAQGRNEAAIADLLVVGRGTVHTHILNVYQKLGLHSQQELIAFVRDA